MSVDTCNKVMSLHVQACIHVWKCYYQKLLWIDGIVWTYLQQTILNSNFIFTELEQNPEKEFYSWDWKDKSWHLPTNIPEFFWISCPSSSRITICSSSGLVYSLGTTKLGFTWISWSTHWNKPNVRVWIFIHVHSVCTVNLQNWENVKIEGRDLSFFKPCYITKS